MIVRSLILSALLLGSLALLAGDAQTTHDLDGEPCPEWVHDHYVTIGPGGASYATWHPLVDPQYQCHYDHEHGIDPSLFWPDYEPAYNYTAQQAGMDEPHHGFKGFLFRGNGRTSWYLTAHMGSFGQGRACTQHHTLDIVVLDHTSPARLVVDLHLLADFGPGQVWDDGAGNVALIPDTTCEGNSEIESDGLRRFPNADAGGIGYEIWRTAQAELSAVGVAFGHTHLAVDDPMRVCADADCATMVEQSSSNAGVARWVTISEAQTGGLRVENPGSNAEFTTNPYGTGPGGVSQFIEPGTQWRAHDIGGKCKDIGGPLGMPMFCGDANPAGIITLRGLIDGPN